MRELYSNFEKASKQNMEFMITVILIILPLYLSCLRFIALFFICGLFGALLWLNVSTVLTLSSTCTVNTSEEGRSASGVLWDSEWDSVVALDNICPFTGEKEDY